MSPTVCIAQDATVFPTWALVEIKNLMTPLCLFRARLVRVLLMNSALLLFFLQVVFEVAGVEVAAEEDSAAGAVEDSAAGAVAGVVEDLEVDAVEEASEEEEVVVDVDSEVGPLSNVLQIFCCLFCCQGTNILCLVFYFFVGGK